jgi:hypothetical protein
LPLSDANGRQWISMEAVIKVTYRGGEPDEALLTVQAGEYQVHLYKCNRSHLMALRTAITKAIESTALLETSPTKMDVIDLVARETPEIEVIRPPKPEIKTNENTNPSLN